MINYKNNAPTPESDGQYSYRYPHPAMTADCVIFGFDGKTLKVLLIERGIEPFKGKWALPGGFMRIDETIEQTAARELSEETGLRGVFLDQFRVYSDVRRDPRERVVTVAFIALVKPDDYRLVAGDDAANALWYDLDFLPSLAFDHRRIITDARAHLGEMLKTRPVAFELLNKLFTMSDLQRVYEIILGTRFDRRNFQRKAMQTGLIAETDSDMEELTSRIPPCPTVSASCMMASEPVIISYSESQPDCGPEASAPSSKPSRTRKLFRFLGLKDHDSSSDAKRADSEAEESSIKDIFNF